MNIYLAAQYHRKDEINKYAHALRSAGIHVTSTWLEEPHDPNIEMSELPEILNAKYAAQDLLDIDDANMLVFFSVSDTELTRRGGRHVEFGYALGTGKPILVVGPRENIFHYKPEVSHVASWDDALELLIHKSVEAMGL